MKADLAIIIPAYKPDYLEQTLDSIAGQTDKRFHLYIGDDCSPSDLYSIVKRYEDKIPLTYHRFEKNIGGEDLVKHWHRCIDLSEGQPYLWLFSDDDIMDSNCVEEFNKLPQKIKDSSLIHFNIRRINSKNKETPTISNLGEFPETMTCSEYIKAKRSGKVVSYVVEFIFPRTVYVSENGFENFDLAWGADFMTWIKFSSTLPNGIFTVPNAKVNWRFSDVNISPDKSYPILCRKIYALIKNAVFLKNLMKTRPEQFESIKKKYIFLIFPLGEIKRNRKYIPLSMQIKMATNYFSQILRK